MNISFARVLRFSRTRTDIGVDLYNLFNTNVAPYLQPDVRCESAGDDAWLGRRLSTCRVSAVRRDSELLEIRELTD